MDTSRGFGASKVNEDLLSSESVDLFKGWGEESSIVQGRNVCIRPSTENVKGPFAFQFLPQGEDQYLQLNSLRLGALCRVLIEDVNSREMTLMDEKEDVAPINMCPSSLFSMVTTEFNDVLVSDLTSPLSHYQTMIQTMLSYNKTAQKTHLQGQMYIPDDPGKHEVLTYNGDKVKMNEHLKRGAFGSDAFFATPFHDKNNYKAIIEEANGISATTRKRVKWSEVTNFAEYKKLMEALEKQEANAKDVANNEYVASASSKYEVKEVARTKAEKLIQQYVAAMLSKRATNSGYVKRRRFTLKSKWFDFYIPIGIDVCQSDRLLHPSVQMRLTFSRNSDTFSLLSEQNKTYRIQLKDLKMFGRYIRVAANIVENHRRLHSTRPLIYPVTRTVMKHFGVNSGQSAIHISSMFDGLLPKNIIITMVEADAFHGSLSKNPYNFQHFNLDTASIIVNGERLPTEPMRPDFKDEVFLREYVESYRNIGIDVNQDSGNLVTPEHFKQGSFFMAFDLTGDQCNMLHRHKTQKGIIDFSALFRESLKQSIELIVHASYEAQIEIPKDRDPGVTFL